MSYTRSFTKRIAVHYSGTESYPASEHGGSVHYSGVAYEDVSIDIVVDTNDFDHEVVQCNKSVGGLTGSIIATESAQIASIHANSRKVGSTIIKGFFDTVRSEISQQIVELQTKIDATLIHLKQLADRCVSQQAQMQADYGRITSRYVKVFDDLNNELENRIFELCRPVFLFKRHADDSVLQLVCSDKATTATVAGAEQTLLEARIASSLAKRRAVDTISQANRFLTKQKRTEYVLNHSAINEAADGNIYLPVCYLETKDNGITNRKAFKPEMLDHVDSQQLVETINQVNPRNELAEHSKALEESFNREVSSAFDAHSEHDKRVMDYITKLYYSNI